MVLRSARPAARKLSTSARAMRSAADFTKRSTSAQRTTPIKREGSAASRARTRSACSNLNRMEGPARGRRRRATTTPFLGDNAQDWVIRKYTHYYSYFTGTLLWRTDAVPLLGVRNGSRVNVYADAFKAGNYPWSGWQADWTTFPDATPNQGTCAGWTATSAGYASFAFADLMPAASELCESPSFILCVEQ